MQSTSKTLSYGAAPDGAPKTGGQPADADAVAATLHADAPAAPLDPGSLAATVEVWQPGAVVEPPATSQPQAATVTASPAGPASRAGQATLIPKSTTVLPKITAGAKAAPAGRPRYEAVKVLGEGGMGEVLLAKDQDIERTVAIKRLRGDGREASAVLRFADEVRTVGALQHPNIVPIYDVGVDVEGQHYFVMKYVDGETLEHIIARLAAGDPAYEDRFPIPIRVQIVIGLLHALEHAHASGVLHRDIKPANVMVGPHGEVTLADWGIARRITPKPLAAPAPTHGRPAALKLPLSVPRLVLAMFLGSARRPEPPAPGAAILADPAPGSSAPTARPDATRPGALVGTPLYMSPEQARGQHDRLDERSDLFSAAVLLGELLSLRHYLADQRTLADVLQGVISQEICQPYILKMVSRNLPHELIQVTLKGMHQDPDLRWQSASEMIEALERCLSGDIWVCCPFTATRRLSFLINRFVLGHPTLVTAAVLLGPVAAVAAVVAVVVGMR